MNESVQIELHEQYVIVSHNNSHRTTTNTDLNRTHSQLIYTHNCVNDKYLHGRKNINEIKVDNGDGCTRNVIQTDNSIYQANLTVPMNWSRTFILYIDLFSYYFCFVRVFVEVN